MGFRAVGAARGHADTLLLRFTSTAAALPSAPGARRRYNPPGRGRFMVGEGGIRIARVFGIPIFLHASWFIIFALITFSLAGHYRAEHPQWSEAQHWMAGILTSLLFFGSVLFHELAHSVTALYYRIPVVSITLFVFGGVARIGRESENWRQEFNIAAAGPLSSYLLWGGFKMLAVAFPSSEMVGALCGWLATINFWLATFNLIPGFPLDGGRILRALVWAATKDFTSATRTASIGGQIVAYAMIAYGIWQAVNDKLVDGLWMAFIGWFLLSAAQETFAQVAIRNTLRGMRAGDVMTREVPTISRSIALEDYLQEIIRTGRRCHLVEGDGRVVGLISVHTLNSIPREEWGVTSVQAAMIPRERIHATRPEEPVLSILERMQSEDINQMPVVARVDGAERVIGLISRDTILRVIQTRLEMSAMAEQ
jgi:Zn-dependent protease